MWRVHMRMVWCGAWLGDCQAVGGSASWHDYGGERGGGRGEQKRPFSVIINTEDIKWSGKREKNMPTISRFYGIKITMNYNDHSPPHFHAEYQDYEATVEIANGNVTGKMPRRALRMLWNWLDEYQEELEENWTRARNRQTLLDITPLD